MSAGSVENLRHTNLEKYCIDPTTTAALVLQSQQLQIRTPIIYLNDCLGEIVVEPHQQALSEVQSGEFPLPLPTHKAWAFVEQESIESPSTTTSADNADYTIILYVCSLCLRQYDLLADLRGHMIEYHKCTDKRKLKATVNKPRPLPGMLKVEMEEPAVCQMQQQQQSEMRPMPFKDFRMVLRAKLTMRCEVTYACSFKFGTTAKRSLHAKCHVTTSNNSMQFQCYECAAEMPNWRRCAMHLWRIHHVDVDLLHCPLCNYKSHTTFLVWRHMRVHEKWRKRVVDSLHATAKRRQQSTVNANQQTKVNVAQQLVPAPNKNRYYAEKTCDICDRKFVNAKILSKHVKTVHNKMKPFICNICGLKSARKYNLTIHLRQHTGERPLQCKHCNFCTRDPSVLSKHRMRHEKVQNFQCESCNYTSIQSNAIKRHIRHKHPEEYHKIACNLCSFVSISAKRLEAHKTDHRKGLIINQEDSMDATGNNIFKNPEKVNFKNETSGDCFQPLEGIDSLSHEPAVDTGGVTIPAPSSEDTQINVFVSDGSC